MLLGAASHKQNSQIVVHIREGTRGTDGYCFSSTLFLSQYWIKRTLTSIRPCFDKMDVVDCKKHFVGVAYLVRLRFECFSTCFQIRWSGGEIQSFKFEKLSFHLVRLSIPS